MMGKKIGIHSQGVKGWYGNFYTTSGGQWFKGIGNYAKPAPGVNVLARIYYDQSQVDNRVREGAAGADRIFAAVVDESSRAGTSWFETPANECSFWDQSVANSVVAFNQRLIQLYHDRGWKIVVGSINAGWPRLVKDDGGTQMNMWMQACRGADGLSFHEGGYKSFIDEAPWNCTRYRFTHEYFSTHGYPDHPPFFITEIALDTGGAHQGWRVILGDNIAEYTRQMIWYENELQKDSYVYAGFVFTTGGEGLGWDSFEWYEGAAMDFARASYVPGPPPGPPAPPEACVPPKNPPASWSQWARLIDVSEYQGEVNWSRVKADGVLGVILRASVARTDGTVAKDAKFWQNVAACEDVQMPFGAYHFFREQPDGQAAFFVNAVYESAASDYFPPLGLWLDCETSLTPDKIERGLNAVDARASEKWGNPKPCGIYTSKSAWPSGASQGDRCLWVAHWNVPPASILIPSGWSDYLLWQHTSDGSVDGISGRVDLDRFHGSPEQFYDFFELDGEPPPTPGDEMDIIVIDSNGQTRDVAYLNQQWGNVTWSTSSTYKTLVFREDFSGSAATVVRLLDEDGDPLVGVEVHCLDGGDAVGYTNSSGDVGFGWGGGSYYPHGGTGPMTIKTGDVTIGGLGWLVLPDGSYTNHYHLNLELRKGTVEPPTPPPTEYAMGIDVDQDDGAVDWQAVKAEGYKFAFIRASYCGSSSAVKDSRFDANWAGAKAAGLLRGAYHDFCQNLSGQAKFFVQTVGEDAPELGHYWAVRSKITSDKVQVGLDAVDLNLGNQGYTGKCHILTNVANWPGGVELSGRRLWVQDLDGEGPSIPSGWTTWEFWRHADGQDWFNGTEAELKAKYGGGPAPTPEIEEAIEQGYAALEAIRAALGHLGEDV